MSARKRAVRDRTDQLATRFDGKPRGRETGESPLATLPTPELSSAGAAQVLETIAERQRAALGDLSALDWDQRALLVASGDLEAIRAIEMGAVALRSQAAQDGVEGSGQVNTDQPPPSSGRVG